MYQQAQIFIPMHCFIIFFFCMLVYGRIEIQSNGETKAVSLHLDSAIFDICFNGIKITAKSNLTRKVRKRLK